MARSKWTDKRFKAEADKLFSRLIRSRGFCERCGATANLQTSHIFSRRFAWTRTDLSNALCLCAACHRWWHDHPTETKELAVSVIGVDEYERINQARQRREKFDWESEWARLDELWCEGEWMGVRCLNCSRLVSFDGLVDGKCGDGCGWKETSE